jgi:hypothetical protein
MAIDSFKFDQLFILLVPERAVWFEDARNVSFPDKPDFVQKSLSISSHSVVPMKGPLRANPNP